MSSKETVQKIECSVASFPHGLNKKSATLADEVVPPAFKWDCYLLGFGLRWIKNNIICNRGI